MDIYKFKLAPAATNTPLPFKPVERPLKKWLDSLEGLTDIEKAQKILFVIQTLNEIKTVSSTQKIGLFAIIYHFFEQRLKQLKREILSYTLPLSTQQQSNIEHIVWIYSELANSFTTHCGIKKNTHSSAQAIYLGLQALTQAYIYISMIYQQPFAQFWKRSYLLYGLAFQQGLLEKKVSTNEQYIDTINKSFKHLLALYHCGLDQLRPNDIFVVSSCVEKYISNMQMTSTPPQNLAHYSAFNLYSDHPPAPLSRIDKTEKCIIHFFSAYEVAKELFSNAKNEASGTGILKSISHETILQAAKSLSMTQKRKYTRFNDLITKEGIIGFKNIVSELAKSSTLSLPIQQSQPSPPSPQLGLVTQEEQSIAGMKNKLGHEERNSYLSKKTQTRIQQAATIFNANKEVDNTAQTIWQDSNYPQYIDPLPYTAPELNIYDSSINGYKIIVKTCNSTPIKIGEIIGIKNNSSIETGVVRRISQLTDNKLELGIKLLSLKTDLAYISLDKEEQTIIISALFLPGIKTQKTKDSVIFDNTELHDATLINLYHPDQEAILCRLSKLLHLSSAATHKELFYSHIINEN
ncbi:MAG: hypothetical protein GQ582_07680 [Methyloprofundus sp.]|nr:hypothetical protein [Methyloprofundus sp.]